MNNQKQTIVLMECPDADSSCKNNLEKMGFDVFEAMGGKEGCRLVEEKKPDLVIAETIMPKGDGFYVLKKIKKLKDKGKIEKNMPVITYADLDCSEDEKEFRKQGADEYIVRAKCSPEKAAIKIKEIIEKSKK